MVKKEILLFLGAGASTTFGKPTTSTLLENFRKKIPESEASELLRKVIDCGYEDFEQLLQALLDLRATVNSPYLGKFFRHWKDRLFLASSFNDHWAKYSEAWWNNNRENFINMEPLFENLDESITILEDVVIDEFSWNDDFTPILGKLYRPIFSFLKENSNSLRIVTTNYDRAIENYCENYSMNYFDGFKEVSGNYWWTGRFYYPEHLDYDSVILYKLHGSLNWKKRKDGKIIRGVGEARPLDRRYIENILIYPSLDIKNYDNAPYDGINQEFVKSFNESELCIIIGCSFRDKQINSVLKNRNKNIIVISPTVEKDVDTNFINDNEKRSDFKNMKFITQYLNEKTVDSLIKQIDSNM